MELNEQTNIKLTMRAFWAMTIAFAIAVFCLGGIYAQAKDLPDRVAKIETELSAKLEREKSSCKILKRIQEQIVPPLYREDVECK